MYCGVKPALRRHVDDEHGLVLVLGEVGGGAVERLDGNVIDRHGWKATGPGIALRSQAVSIDVRGHVTKVAEQGYTIVEDAIDLDHVDALAADLERLEAELDIKPATNSFEGSSTWRIYNLLVHGDLYERIPVHPNVLPIVEGVLDYGCLISSLSSIAIGPGETRAADPRRRSADPAAEAAPADGVQHDVGAHRLHRSERRHPHHPGHAPVRPQPQLRPALRLDRGRDAEGLGARLARQPLARRR